MIPSPLSQSGSRTPTTTVVTGSVRKATMFLLSLPLVGVVFPTPLPAQNGEAPAMLADRGAPRERAFFPGKGVL
jgi:hypothetical protein